MFEPKACYKTNENNASTEIYFNVFFLSQTLYLILRYILESVIGQVKGMHGIIMSLDNRVKNMNNDMIKLDIQISDALNLRQDEERISRADGKEDARRD